LSRKFLQIISDIREYFGGDIMNTIGQRIRYARKMNKLSLTDVKEITGLSTGNLSELENDKFMPSANALISFKKVFNVSIDWILTGEPPMTPSSGENIKKIPERFNLNDEEKELIEAYRSLDEERRRDIQGFIHVVTQQKPSKQEKDNK